MPDPDPRFSSLDLLEPTDLSGEIGRRARLPEPAPMPETSRRRVVAGLVAAAIFTAVAVFAWSALRPLEQERPIGETPEPSAEPSTPPQVDAWRGLAEGATELPPPPSIRSGDVRVWTGTQLIVWGGNTSGTGDPPHGDDGSVFDAATRTWSELPASPLSPRSWAGGVWTGAEVVIWGGAEGSWPGERPLADGAAFDPSTGTWRMLPPAPIAANAPTVAVWTGTEAIFWGSYEEGVSGTGIAYDPASDGWRTIPDPPVPMTDSVTAAWTGDEIVVLGGSGRKLYANAAAYSPALDSWRPYPNGQLDANAVGIAAVGDGVVGADYNKRAVMFVDDSWSSLPSLPLETCEGFPAVVSDASGTIVVELCGGLVSMRVGEERWHRVLADRFLTFTYAGAGDAVLLLSYEDNAAMEDRRATLLAFRPPVAKADPVSQAEDFASAFASLRTEYPYDSHIPPDAESEMRRMLAATGAAAWEQEGMSPLWAYYTGFDVVSVERLDDGSFVAVIGLDGYSTSDTVERITIASGADLDGVERDLVIVDARRIADHPPVSERPDGTGEVLLDLGDDAAFPSGALQEGDTVWCDGSSLLVPAPGTYVEDPPDEPGPDPNDGEGFSITTNLDGSVEARCLPR